LIDVDAAAPFFLVDVAVAALFDGPEGVLNFVVDVATAEAKFGTLVAGKRVVVFPLMTKAVACGESEMVVPWSTMKPPGVKVIPSMM
jgi:hypothetical protein